jgi:hypothetical protein
MAPRRGGQYPEDRRYAVTAAYFDKCGGPTDVIQIGFGRFNQSPREFRVGDATALRRSSDFATESAGGFWSTGATSPATKGEVPFGRLGFRWPRAPSSYERGTESAARLVLGSP